MSSDDLKKSKSELFLDNFNDKKLQGFQNTPAIENAIRQVLINVGEDPERNGLLKTPHRVAKMFSELLEGYTRNLSTIVNGALYDADYGQEVIIVDDIEYNSMCEHHMLPFTGKAHIAYIPNEKIIGLSKLPRIVDMFSKRLQVQERLTNQIADAIEEVVNPKGIIVVLDGHHMCASLRGVKKTTVNMRTLATRGLYKESKTLRSEFFELIKR
jgi:GTP cyclohydrolase I